MTPEQDIARVIGDVCPDSSHWPYTRKSSLYVGWRPRDDGPWRFASNGPIRVAIAYDVGVCCDRSRLQDAEALRFSLYAALRDAGWMLSDNGGPEVYNAQTQMYLWGFSVVKGFDLDDFGQPHTVD